ncbi:MAG TPA: hypothetical protein VKT77_09530 [Chthonomonadaceae bacterium]|nr:hypothetical protein [Chthonomonadaceae bacterium]
MTMLRERREPDAREAEENLRVIRALMERSTKYSTFSGLSGICAGLASIVGCVITRALGRDPDAFSVKFLALWSAVIVIAIGVDYLLMKRRAARVGKHVISRLGKQMVIAAAPGLGAGAAITFYLLQHGQLGNVFPFWMLAYGLAVSATGLFSQREVSYLGAAFLLAGTLALFLPGFGLTMMALSFGGFHIVYALAMSRKEGW